MTTCSTCEALMPDALFGELSAADRLRFDAHLAASPTCAEEYRTLRGTLDLTAAPARPDPSEAYWQVFEAEVMHRVENESRGRSLGPRLAAMAEEGRAAVRRLGRTLAEPRLAWHGLAAAALIAFGIWIGRGGTTQAPAGDMLAGETPVAVPAEPTLQRAGQYLGRSKMLLLGIVNTQPSAGGAALDLSRQQALARKLLAESPELRAELEAAGADRLRELVADLELILLQIAHLEAGLDVPAVELIQHSVDQQALLLQINLTEMRAAPSVEPAAVRVP